MTQVNKELEKNISESWAKVNPFISSFKYKYGMKSSAIISGISNTLSRLNFEFSSAIDVSLAFSKRKMVPIYNKSDANFIDVEKGIKVGDSIPSSLSKNILVATSWRTGSTFLGELLNVLPGSFYFFETFHHIPSEENFTSAETPLFL